MVSPLDLRFVAVTGKGGVGKTTVAAAVSRLAASRGRRVLLCDLDASGVTAQALGVDPVGYEPVEVEPGIDLMQMATADALHHYLRTFTPFAPLGRIRPLARALDLMGGGAPGVREVLALGRLLWAVRTDEYDLVVMDGPATGHVVAHLDSPHSVGALASGGLLAGQTRWMRELLRDPALCGVLAVALPEEAPAAECCELIDDIRSLDSAPIAGVAVNRLPPGVGLASDRAILAAAPGLDLSPGSRAAVDALVRERDRDDVARGWARLIADRADPAPIWSVPHERTAAVVGPGGGGRAGEV